MKFEVYMVLVFLLFLAVDVFFPFREKTQSTMIRWASNYGLYLTNWFIGRAFTATAIIVFAVITEKKYGLFSIIDVHPLVVWAVSLLALDLVDYGKHRLLHTWQWTWRFHRIHHSDRDFDFTTAVRFHPFDDIYTAVLELALLLLLGVPLEVYLFYAFLLTFINFFVHSNIALPPRIERLLSMVIITPNLHRVHHSMDTTMYDTNFGVILSIWDRLFGSLNQVEEQKEIQTGIAEFEQPGELTYLPMLTMPFKGSREERPSHITSSPRG